MNKSNIWIGLSLCVSLVFFMVDVSFYHSYKLFLGSILSLLIAFFVYKATTESNLNLNFILPNDSDSEEKLPNEKKKRILGYVLGFLCFTIIGSEYSEHFDSKVNYAFEKESVLVNGVITNGSEEVTQRTKYGIETSRSSKFSLTVTFETKDNKKFEVTEDISSDDFKDVYLGKPIRLIYYKENPKMIKLLLNNEDLKKYAKVEDRNLTGSDILKILNTERDKIKPMILNKISLDWTSKVENSNDLYFNSISKNESILLHEDNLIFSRINENENCRKFLEPFKIEKEDSFPTESLEVGEIEKKLFQTKNYFVTFQLSEYKEKKNIDNSLDSSLVFDKIHRLNTYVFNKRN